MRPILPGVLVTAMLMLSACGGATTGSSSAPATAPSSTSPATTSGTSSDATAEITVGTDTAADLQFDPAEFNVRAGSTVQVKFENRASIPHNLTFQAPISAATTMLVEPGSSATVEFKAPDPGEYSFVCTLHPGMGGKLVVEAG